MRRLIGMGLPCVLLSFLDVTLTLLGQPWQYWAGDYSRVNEAMPTFRDLLQRGPWAAVAGHLVWVVIFLSLLLLLPEVLAVIFCIVVVFGHTYGAASWLRYSQFEYQLSIALFLASAVVLGIGLHWTLRAPAFPGKALPRRRLAPTIRWALIALLIGVVSYVYLVPQ
jgi:hypothetical protein